MRGSHIEITDSAAAESSESGGVDVVYAQTVLPVLNHPRIKIIWQVRVLPRNVINL